MQKIINRYEEFIKKYNKYNSKMSLQTGNKPQYIPYENKWLEEFCYKDFETLRVKVSVSYDEILKRFYGDYMKIPKNKNGTYHGEIFFDTEKSYKYYMNENNKKLIDYYEQL